MGSIAAIIGSGCCCDGTPCGVCNDTPTSVAVNSSLSFDWGWPPECECPYQSCDGLFAVDWGDDIGSVVLNTGGFGITTTDFPGNTWDTPDYGPGTERDIEGCAWPGLGTPCYVSGPFYNLKVRCRVIDGVAYGEVALTLWRSSGTGFGIDLGVIYYRKQVEGTDCQFPLGTYTYAEHDFDWEPCEVSPIAPRIRNIDFGTFEVS